MDKLLIASANPKKVRELEAILSPLGVGLVSLSDLGLDGQVEEDAATLEGNALKKARYWHKRTGMRTLADDTGLEVDALKGAPGVRSARYAGEQSDDRANVARLLQELVGESNRSAHFRTVIALVGEKEHLFEGICRGEILAEPRGQEGFGYDPVFRPEGEERSFAELTADEKNRISHRGLALQKVAVFLASER